MAREPAVIAEQRRTLGDRLATFRQAASLTQGQLAQATICHRTQVTHIEKGRARADERFWRTADDACHADGTLLAGFHELEAAKAEHEQRTREVELATHRAKIEGWQARRAVSGGGSTNRAVEQPVHAGLLAQFETLTDTYRQIDYQAGARTVYLDTVAHLNRLLDAAHRVPSGLYQRFILDLGDVAQLAAWLAIDGQDYATARQYCGLALSAAQEGEDPSLHAYTLGVMSYIHLHAGRGSEALRLLQAALRIAESPQFGVNPAVRSWLFEAIGEAHALVGDKAAGARALHRAEVLFDAVRPDDVPSWLSFFNAECHIIRLKGRCLTRLGQYQAAITTLEAACDSLPEQYIREQSGTQIDLAAAHLLGSQRQVSAAELDTAAEIANDAFRKALATESGRNQRRVRELLLGFRPYSRHDTVQALIQTVG
jgi:tetratricopeptide (TPR) repeat protein/DNA-binding XRE family transcriptional regulator